MPKNALPNIARLANQLAADNVRVTRYLERLPDRTDELVGALRQADWTEVRRLSQRLAIGGQTYGYDTIRYRAERVCEEIRKPNNLRAVKQCVVRLIGACGSVRRRGTRNEPAQIDWQI